MYVHDKRDLKVPKYNDRYGRVLHKGDLCLECRGNAYGGGWDYLLYEVPGLDPFNHFGTVYNFGGNQTEYGHVSLSIACKLDPAMLGDDILFTFYHGGHQLKSQTEFDSEYDNSLEIIKDSDYWVMSYAKVAGLDITKDIVPCPRCGKTPLFFGKRDDVHHRDDYTAKCKCGAVYQVSSSFNKKDESYPESLRRPCVFGWNRLAAGIKIPASWQDPKPTPSDTKPT